MEQTTPDENGDPLPTDGCSQEEPSSANMSWSVATPGANSIKLYGSVNYGFVVTANF